MLKINKIEKINGEYTPPPDKSISHRAFIISCLTGEKSYINNFLLSKDVFSTIKCLNILGNKIEVNGNNAVMTPIPLFNFTNNAVLDCGNSGTTAKLLSGILSSIPNKKFTLIGDESLTKRPNIDLFLQLNKLGGKFDGNFMPINIYGNNLLGKDLFQTKPSAQIKSAVLLAGLNSQGKTSYTENIKTRNHTELLIKYLGGNIDIDDSLISINKSNLFSKPIEIVGDISSASYLIALAVLSKNSHLVIKNVGLNPTRMGFIDVLIKMGADISIEKNYNSYEPFGNLIIKSSNLKGIIIEEDLTTNLIDEVPLLSIISLFAEGITVIKGCNSLITKETNRLQNIYDAIKKVGGNISLEGYNLIIEESNLKSCTLDSYNDHRLAMSYFTLFSIIGDGIIENENCVDISYPNFYKDILNLCVYY